MASHPQTLAESYARDRTRWFDEHVWRTNTTFVPITREVAAEWDYGWEECLTRFLSHKDEFATRNPLDRTTTAPARA
jgi:hypothetical protein